jgi:hypothetical protein
MGTQVLLCQTLPCQTSPRQPGNAGKHPSVASLYRTLAEAEDTAT